MPKSAPGALRRNRHLVIAFAIIVAFVGALVVAFKLRQNITLKEAPLANIPRQATAVGYVRVAPVLQSPLWRAVVNAQGFEDALTRLRQRCGFDPLAQVEDVTVFTEGDGTPSLERLGVVGRGPFDHERLGRCLRDALREDGQGDMRRIEIDGVPAVAPERGNSRAAFLGLRGIAIGTLENVRRVIATVRDGAPSAEADADLARLWNRVARGRELVLVGHLPRDWQSVLVRQLGPERSRPITEALTGMRAMGIGARVSSGLGLGVVLSFGEEAKAAALLQTITDKLATLRDNIVISLTPVGPLVRLVETERQGNDVVLTLDLNEERLSRLLAFAAALTGGADALQAGGGSPTTPAMPPPADDTIRPASP